MTRDAWCLVLGVPWCYREFAQDLDHLQLSEIAPKEGRDAQRLVIEWGIDQ